MKIKIPIYGGLLKVIYVKDMSKVIKKYNLTDNCYNHDAFCFKHKGIYYAIFQTKKPSIVAHESVHIVNMIFEDSNIQLDLINDETQAYLTGWVFNKISKAIKWK